MFYQPFIHAEAGDLAGCEALMRWHNENLGEVSPATFIPVIEESGRIIEFGLFALRTAIEQAKHWLAYRPDFVMAINISPVQLQDVHFVESINHLCQLYDVNTGNIELELTENIFLGNDPAVLGNIERLAEAGYRLSLDDFGTGYSSLSYLHRYPFSTIKIDREFIADVEHSDKSRMLVKTIIALAEGLGLQTICEGTETPQQVAFARKSRSKLLQGYYYSKPVPAELFFQRFLAIEYCGDVF
jgi:EAL domain-containing protein (putative c-di-GMP-specific phosphodiesterase class I)